MNEIQALMKALEAGSYNAAPTTLVQGAALQHEDLSPVMQNVCADDSAIKLQKALSSRPVKSTLNQFVRQLDHGIFGGSAQYEGGIGEEETSNYARIGVPIAYYSHVRRTSVQSELVSTFDGVNAGDRAAKDAAQKIAEDIEFDAFKGNSDFSNGGVFDGNPASLARIPNMLGIDQQVRVSDSQSNTQDLMFAEYGSDQTVVLSAGGGALTQSLIEDAAVRSAMNHGTADRLLLDPISLSAYNKIAHAKERIMLAGSAQEATGAHLRTQWTSSSIVALEHSRFLSGKTRPARARAGSPAAPTISTAVTGASVGSLLQAATYTYYATACSPRGESTPSAASAQAVAVAGDKVTVTITAVSGATHYNVYASAAGGSAASAKFIGRIAQGSGNPAFTDLGNRPPGCVTGFLLQMNTMDMGELAPFTKFELAKNDLSTPFAGYRFCSVSVMQPRKNVLIEAINGQLVG